MAVTINGTSNSPTLPALTGTDSDTGIFFDANGLAFSINGVEQARIDINGNLGVDITPDGSSIVQIAAGSTTRAPLELTAGTNMTVPDDGSIEYDGKAFYLTPVANNRGVVVAEHFVARTGTKTLGTGTSLQSLFSGGTGGLTNGALTVAALTSYYFECLLSITSMSATGGNLGFSIVGGGTATFTSAGFITYGFDANTLTTPATGTAGVYVNTTALTTNIVTSTTGTGCAVLIKGIFRINAAGTIIPSVQLTTSVATAVIGADTWFKCYPVGSNTAISVGNWS